MAGQIFFEFRADQRSVFDDELSGHDCVPRMVRALSLIHI